MAENTVSQYVPKVAYEVLEDFVSHYKGDTRKGYETDVRIFFAWCEKRELNPLEARRRDIEAFLTYLMEERHNSGRSAVRRYTSVRGFYKIAIADELVARDPMYMVRLPKWHHEVTEAPWLDRDEMVALLRVAEATSPAQHVLVALMATHGLRVSEACNIMISDIRQDDAGYTTITVLRKGGHHQTIPVPIPLLRSMEKAIDGRESGPLIRTSRGAQQNRNGAYRWVKQLCQKAGLPANIRPHSMRHSAITAFVKSGATILEAQKFADHADIRATETYYHEVTHHDQHGSHAVARYWAAG